MSSRSLCSAAEVGLVAGRHLMSSASEAAAAVLVAVLLHCPSLVAMGELVAAPGAHSMSAAEVVEAALETRAKAVAAERLVL